MIETRLVHTIAVVRWQHCFRFHLPETRLYIYVYTLYIKDPINEQTARQPPNFFALFGKEAIADTISTPRK